MIMKIAIIPISLILPIMLRYWQDKNNDSIANDNLDDDNDSSNDSTGNDWQK